VNFGLQNAKVMQEVECMSVSTESAIYTLQFCSRDAVTCLKAKSFFFFFLFQKRCAAVDVSRKVSAAKTVVQQKEADIRRFALFPFLIIRLHSSLSETTFG